MIQGILHDPTEGGLRITSDVVFPKQRVPIIPPPPPPADGPAGNRRLLQTDGPPPDYAAISESLVSALSNNALSIYPASDFSMYGSPFAPAGSPVQAAAYRGGAASAQTRPHPEGHYNTVNFTDSSIFTVGAATPAPTSVPAATPGPLYDVVLHGGVEFPHADFDDLLYYDLMGFVLNSVVNFIRAS